MLHRFLKWLGTRIFAKPTQPVKSSSRTRLAVECLEGRELMSANPLTLPANWFSTNVSDPGVAALAQTDFTRDNSLTRSDMLGLFAEVKSGNVVTSAEVRSLRTLVANASLLNMPDYVHNLANKVVNSDRANSSYLGKTLGNLHSNSTVTQLQNLVNKWFLGLDHPRASGTYSVVSAPLFSGGVSYGDVAQGSVGDCWLMASLAEVAARKPSILQHMFISNGDGTYDVRLYHNGVADYVTVDSALPGGGTIYDRVSHANVTGGSTRELWAALAEKAFAQENREGWLATLAPASNSYAGIDGGDMASALAAITGLHAGDFAVNPTDIAKAWKDGQFIVFGTPFHERDSRVESDHAYAVVSYRPTSSQPFTVFNPWGVHGGRDAGGQFKPGIFTVTNSQVKADFDFWSSTV